MMYGYYNYGFYPFQVLGSIFMAVFWIVLIILLVRFLRREFRHGHGRGVHDFFGGSAMDILKERYVKGEITREEFERMKKDIE